MTPRQVLLRRVYTTKELGSTNPINRRTSIVQSRVPPTGHSHGNNRGNRENCCGICGAFGEHPKTPQNADVSAEKQTETRARAWETSQTQKKKTNRLETGEGCRGREGKGGEPHHDFHLDPSRR